MRISSLIGGLSIAFAITGLIAGYSVTHFGRTVPLEPVTEVVRWRTVLDETGQEIEDRPYSWWVEYEEIPTYLREVLVVQEDIRLRSWSHFLGFDPVSIPRVARGAGGGSGIPIQVARTWFDGEFAYPDGSLAPKMWGVVHGEWKSKFHKASNLPVRKLNELALAFRLEKEFSAEELITLYVNCVYFGQRRGAKRCYQHHFGGSLSEMDDIEALAFGRAANKPRLMLPKYRQELYEEINTVTNNFQNDNNMDGPWQMPLDYYLRFRSVKGNGQNQQQTQRPLNESDSDFWARREFRWELKQKTAQLGLDLTGASVHTTINRDLQRSCQEFIDELPDGVEGAIIVMDSQTGAILTVVGGKQGYLCHATAVKERGLHSCLKPMLYLVAFQKAGYHPGTVVIDMPYDRNWPKNSDGRWLGPISLHRSFIESRNPSVIRIAGLVNYPFLQYAGHVGLNRPGIPHRTDYLGRAGAWQISLKQLTALYSSFNNGGLYPVPYTINAIESAQGEEVYRATPRSKMSLVPDDGVRAEVAQRSHDWVLGMMAASVSQSNGTAFYLNGALPGETIAAKTGTGKKDKRLQLLVPGRKLSIGIWIGCEGEMDLPSNASALKVGRQVLRALPEPDRTLNQLSPSVASN